MVTVITMMDGSSYTLSRCGPSKCAVSTLSGSIRNCRAVLGGVCFKVRETVCKCKRFV